LETNSNGSSLIGRRLGVYQVLAPLGAGGMGEVYRARDTRLQRDVAVKVLPPAFTADSERVARFEREARVLAALNDPHIAAIYGVEQFGGTDALVLELVDGETLAERIRTREGLARPREGSARRPGLPVAEALEIARQIGAALEAAHEKGIVHRDLKPTNIMITPGGLVKVLDFGLAKQDGGAAYFAVAQNGTVVFTPGGYARTLVRVDRNGRRTPLLDDRRGFRGPEISPDGRRIAITIDPRPSQIWVYDLARRSGIPLATTGHNIAPLWTPDGRRVAYSGDLDIVWRAADASSSAERLLARERPQYPTSWSSDGRLLIFDDGELTGHGYDIWALPIGGQPYALLATPDNEAQGQLSPDERWLAYHSNESGRHEIYVRPFPRVNERKWIISTGGGREPSWSPSG
jgi:serine/threonine protein kinase